MNRISRFKGEYAFLSNFYFSPFEFEEVFYSTAEHAFQTNKTRDEHERRLIRKAKTPGEARRLGKTVNLRPEWEDIKLGLMRRIVFAKFRQSQRLSKKLIETEDAKLIEANSWSDTFWGVCNGVGQNHLGKILMEVREVLKER